MTTIPCPRNQATPQTTDHSHTGHAGKSPEEPLGGTIRKAQTQCRGRGGRGEAEEGIMARKKDEKFICKECGKECRRGSYLDNLYYMSLCPQCYTEWRKAMLPAPKTGAGASNG